MAKLTVVPAPRESGAAKVKAVVTKSNKAGSIFSDSNTLALERYRITTHGGSGHGKTFFAASASEFWPKQLPAAKPVTLEDMLWVAFDAGAVAGFREQRINIPHVIDVRKLMTPSVGKERPYAKSILDALTMVINATSEAVETLGVKWVVFDTISMLDRLLNKYWEDNCPTTKAGAKDKFAMYRCIGISHQRIHEAAQLLDAHAHFLCHSKARIEADPNERSQKNRQKAAETPGDNDLIPDITGQSLNTYTANVSAEFALIAKKMLGGKMERKVYALGHQGYRGKNRWQLSLGEEEPADLGLLIRKIEANR